MPDPDEQLKNKTPQPKLVKKPSKVAELVTFAKANTEHREVNFGTIPNFQAQEVNSQAGVFVRGSSFVLDTSGVRHALFTHGNHKLESERGQVGLSDSDFDLLPEILKNPDRYESGNTNGRRQSSVAFLKKIGNRTYTVVLNVVKSKAGSKLVFKTMYIKK